MPPKLFSFTQFRKNASATPFVSHTFKTKDLKPFRFTHFQKKGGGSLRRAAVVIPSEPEILAADEGSQCSKGREPQSSNHEPLHLTPLHSTLPKKAPATPLPPT